MRRILPLFLLVLVAGCVRVAVPAYDAGDVVPQPALAGLWCDDGNPPTTLRLTPVASSRFLLRCLSSCEPLEEGRDYMATPFALDGRTYLDLALRPAGPGDEEPLTPHTVIRVYGVDDTRALVGLLSPDAVREAVRQDGCPPDLAGDDEELVVLAGTERLRALLRRHGDALFGSPSPVTRCAPPGP